MKNSKSTNSLQKEFVGGITTFLTMSYIIFVNPSILSTPGTGMTFSGVLTATVLLCFSMTLFMGLYAKLPYAVAPGMGINAFFAYTLILGKGIPWQTALGIVFWSGLIFLVISISPIRVKIAQAIPLQLRSAAAVGIGLFLTFLGFKNAGLIVAHPVTLVSFGKITTQLLLSLGGLFICVYFLRKKQPLAFLAGIFFVTFSAYFLGYIQMPQEFLSMPDMSSVLFKLDVWGALQLSLLPAIVAIFFTDFFDSLSTFIGVSHASKLTDKNGDPLHMKEGLLVDAVATMGAGLLGTSSGTAYIESAAGIEAGGRTGLASVVTAFCFLPFLFIAPLAGMIPAYATAPVLILVGFLMFRSVSQLSLERIEESLPAFMTIILIPLTFSITQGIVWGFIAHVLCYLVAGRAKDINPIMYAVSAVSLILLIFENYS